MAGTSTLFPKIANLNKHPQWKDSLDQKPFNLVLLPFVAFTPETSWIFGGAGSLSFRFKGEPKESHPSQLLLGAAYTLNKQVLSYLNYQVYHRNEQFKWYGELGYYLYSYPFYGIGNDIPEENKETYEAIYPRVRINALYLLRSKLYGGIRYWMDDFSIRERKKEGLLEQGNVPGESGGLLSGLGLVFNYDSRDNIFFPSSGQFVELVFFQNTSFLGSDFDYTKYSLDAGFGKDTSGFYLTFGEAF